MFFSWLAPVPLTTNCQRKTRHVIMKTQIRICLTVEFKAYFLIFRFTATRDVLAVVRPGCRTPRRVLKPTSLDDINKGRFWGRLAGDAQHLSNCPIRQVIRFYSFAGRFRG